MSEWITACSGIYLGILIVVLLLGLCRHSYMSVILSKCDNVFAKKQYALILVTVCSLILLSVQLLRHYAFETTAFDLRIHTELIRNTRYGVFMYSDTLGTSFLSYHVSLIFPILSLLLPLSSNVVFLLILQGVFIGLAAYFLWLLAMSYNIRPALTMALVIIFFSYHGLLSGYFRGFHQEVLAICFILGFFLAERKNKRCLGMLFFMLALSCREDYAVCLLAYGLILLFKKERQWWGISVVVASFVWLIITYGWIIPSNGDETMVGVERWSHLGDNYNQIAMTLISHPLYWLNAFFGRGPVKLFSRLLFLPLLDVSTVVPIFIPLLVNTASTSVLQTKLTGAYASFYVPFLFAGMVRVLSRERLKDWIKNDCVCFIFCIILLLINTKELPFPEHVKGQRPSHGVIEELNNQSGKKILAQATILAHLNWNNTCHGIGTATAGNIQDYDLILFDLDQNPWPLTTEQLKELKDQLEVSGEWDVEKKGKMMVYRNRSNIQYPTRNIHRMK